MFVNAVPPGALEILLFIALVGAFVFVVARVVRRNAYIPDAAGLEEVETVVTASRFEVEIRRILRDGDSAVADGVVGGQRISFILADFSSQTAFYRSALRTKATIALYALATLQPSDRIVEATGPLAGIEATGFSLTHSGPLRNDYALLGRIQAVRNGDVDGSQVYIYQFDRPDGLSLEAAVEAAPNLEPLAVGRGVIGTARLYGYLPQEKVAAD